MTVRILLKLEHQAARISAKISVYCSTVQTRMIGFYVFM